MLNGIRSAGRTALVACALLVASCSPSATEAPEPKTEFNIGWSIYAGWMPWPYAQQAGIVKKWADKYGLEINFVQDGVAARANRDVLKADCNAAARACRSDRRAAPASARAPGGAA